MIIMLYNKYREIIIFGDDFMKRFSKLFVSFLLISALTFCAVLSVNAAPLPLYGDVLSDGGITVADATQISKYLTDSVKLTDEQLVEADYNGDGTVSVDDVTAIQKMLVGLPYKYTHNLYEVEYAGFSAEDLTAVSFNVDKNYRTYDYKQSYHSSINNLFKTYGEYSRFFDETFDEYNEEFFENNAIIFLYRHYTSGSIYFTVDNVYVKDNILYLEIKEMHPEGGVYTDDLAQRNQFISVSKADVENVDKIIIKDSMGYYSYY